MALGARYYFDMTRYYFIVISVLFVAVNQTYLYSDMYLWVDEHGTKHLTNKLPPKGVKIIKQLDDQSAKDYEREFVSYFPDGTLNEKQHCHNSYNQRYSKYLSALQEPVFKKPVPEKTQVYRFLWLRTFDVPVCIRINIGSGSSTTLTIKVTNGLGGYFPGDIIKNRTIILTEAQKNEFLDTLLRNKFWDLKNEKRSGKDGARWLIEGIKENKYHVTHSWSPKSNNSIREIGMLMLQLSGNGETGNY
jgi:hypothetical protein